MAPPQRKLPAGYELAVGAHRGHRVTKPNAEKPFRTRPSRLPSVSEEFINIKLNLWWKLIFNQSLAQ